MQVIVTEELLKAIGRAVGDLRSEASRVKCSESYEKLEEGSPVKIVVDKAIEQRYQDADLIVGWLERIQK